MDIARQAPKKTAKKILIGTGSVVLLLGILGLTRLKPAAPSIERQNLLLDTVKNGSMVFQVRGMGTLVPVDVRIITAQTPCKVDRILLLPGTEVKANSVIAQLSSPELTQGTDDAFWALKKAESAFHVGVVSQKGNLETAQAAFKQQEANYKATQLLAKEGLVGDHDVLKAKSQYEEAVGKLASEKARMDLFNGNGGMAPDKASLEQAKAQYALKKSQMAALQVRASMAGVLQQVPLQVGQQLTAGATLAKVAKLTPLKAELKVSETQAKDVQVGQTVAVDTRNGIVQGKVIRIDPSVQNGTVTVDVSLQDPLPNGARPDLSVEGVIELDRKAQSVFVGRPVQAQANSGVQVFKLSPDGKEAFRVPVKLGRTSVANIEVLQGLQPGDQIILSDTSQFDSHDRIRLK